MDLNAGQERRESKPRRAVPFAVLCGLCALAGVLIGRMGNAGRERLQGTETAREPASELGARAVEGRRSSPTVVGRMRPRSPADCDSSVNSPAQTSALLISQIRRLPGQTSSDDDVLEGRVNRLNDYFLGMSLTLESLNPAFLAAVADQFADDICSGRHRTDMDLMLFARLALIQPGVSSERALNCAFDGRKAEDTVLWSLLRAWNSTGRPIVPAIDAIAADATDVRTRRLLLPPNEAQDLMRKQIIEASQAADLRAPSRAQRPQQIARATNR